MIIMGTMPQKLMMAHNDDDDKHNDDVNNIDEDERSR